MSFHFDIYVLSKLRTKPVIEAFINKFSNREDIENRQDEELMVSRLGFEDYEWIPAISITNVVEFGLSVPVRGYSFYLPSNKKDIHTLIIAFTTDNYVIFGLSIEEKYGIESAKMLLLELFNDYQGISGGIFMEEPPSLHSKEFIEKIKGKHSLMSI